MKKMNVGVVFGGRSGEHEVSLVSATSVMNALDKEKYNLVQLGITPDGEWFSGEDCIKKFKSGSLEGLKKVNLTFSATHPQLLLDNGVAVDIDLFFPVLHGPFGEDGTIQGLFEMMNVPYVGCGVLASSTAMDKLQCKAIWEQAGLPVVPYVGFNQLAWETEKETILEDVKETLRLPYFVKPANMGSSVGITKVKESKDLEAAIEEALKFDRRVVVETGVNAREIEFAVLGNDDVEISSPGEILVGGEFYDFNDKYVNGVSMTQIPAKELNDELVAEMQEIVVSAYKLLDCSGLSRVDCFVDKDNGEVFLNEINTMPGFTSISMYPKMMEHLGIPYSELLNRLIQLATDRFNQKSAKEVSYNSGSDWFKE